MANNGPRDSTNTISSVRPGSRHQLKRSITDFTSPVKLSRRTTKDRDRDREPGLYRPISPNPYIPSRASVDIMPIPMPRSEGVTPLISPDQSRRPSIRVGEEENKSANTAIPPEHDVKTEESSKEEQEKASLQVQ